MEKRDRMMEESPVKLIRTRRFGDERGWFSETYVESRWMELGANARFVQDNHSYSRPQGTIRGIHFQSPPHAQAKLIRCVRGGSWIMPWTCAAVRRPLDIDRKSVV